MQKEKAKESIYDQQTFCLPAHTEGSDEVHMFHYVVHSKL